MSPSPETRDFLFFQESGDAEALARVFDRTAPRLLLLAAHFARDAAEAEDLVQTTFLQALRDVDRFDARRDVQPWLAGILRHRALDQVRRHRRRAEVDEPEEDLAELRATPLEEVAERENYERLTRAIEDLDERYRDVLVLRLVHELEPASIARALGRSPSGVRTQVQRGLEKLREALRGDRALLALLPLTGMSSNSGGTTAGLEAVRNLVVREAAKRAAVLAPTAAAGTAASFLLPTLTMKIALASIALALAGFFALRSGGSEVTTATSIAPQHQVAESDTDRELALLSSPVPSEPIALPEPAAIRTPLQASGEAKGIEVHVTDSGGQPIEGIGLYLKRGRQQQIGREAQTDDKGIALFAGPFGVEEDVVLELHADRARAERFVYPNRERVVHWVLGEGQTVSGQVVDLEGKGVSGAAVYRINNKHHDRMQQLATSDSAGRFTLHHLEGDLRFLARAEGYQPSEIERVRRGEVELELGAFGVKVHGTVVDDQNQPVPHAWVAFAVDEDAREEPGGSQRTPEEGDGDLKLDREGFFVRADAQGHFATNEVPRGHAVVLARTAPESPRPLIGWSAQWINGDLVTPMVVSLELAGTIHGQLTGPAGEPLEGFPFESQWEGDPEFGEIEDDLGQLFTQAACLTDEEGKYALHGLFPGEYDITVVNQDSKDSIRGEINLGRGETAVFDASLSALASLHLRLVDPQGAPLEGWRVRQFAASSPDSRETTSRPRYEKLTGTDGEVSFLSLEPGPLHVEFAAPANEEDSLPITVATRRLEAELFAESEDSPPVVLVQLSEGELPTASFEGWLHSVSGEARSNGTMVLTRKEIGSETRVWCADDGHFEIHDLSAGTWTLHASKNQFGGRGEQLAEIELEAGQHRDLGVLNDAKRTTLKVSLFMEGDGDWAPVSLKLDVNGEEAVWLGLNGEYITSVLGHDGSAQLRLYSEGFAPFRVPLVWENGETLTKRIPVQRGRFCRLQPGVPTGSSEDGKNWRVLDVQIHDDEGLLRNINFREPASRGSEIEFWLRPGSYVLRVIDSHAAEEEQEFDLQVLDEEDPFAIDLRTLPRRR